MTDTPPARPVCEQCGTRLAIPGVRFCLTCLDRQVLEYQATLGARRRRA
jgi:hypothetical protein